MKRVFLAAVCVFSLCTTVAFAQSSVPAYKKNYVNKQSNSVEKAREKLGESVDKLSRSVDSVDEDLVKVGGKKYMPLYSTNLYKGSEGEAFMKECRSLFVKRYPNARIMSVTIPQTSWLKEDMVKGGKTIGTTQTMYCFIIAADGSNGYINARFTYKRYKNNGGTYSQLADYWPKWDRTDMLSNATYEKLRRK